MGKQSTRILVTPKGYVTAEDISEKANVCLNTVYRWVKKGIITPDEEYSRNNRFLFEWKKLKQDLAQHNVFVL